MHLPEDIHEKALQWAQSPIFDKKTSKEIQDLLDQKNEAELINRFYKDLEFGTGGMRGIMGAGTFRINIYNIRKATHALAQYLRSLYLDKTITVAIAYDSRHNSRTYAQTTAEVLSGHKIKTLITKEMRPVPLLSFMVRHFECQAGVCITASHNPSQYNGYKVYWQDGGQIVPPHDKKIFQFYNASHDLTKIPSVSFEIGQKQNLIKEIDDELDSAYLEQLKTVSFFSGKKDLQIVYTPLHGTGVYVIPKALKLFGFQNVSIVKEQAQPDGDFPTVPSPNPEDPRSLTMALELASSIKADIVLATDPDSDRLAVVVNENGQWVNFSGNQMGALLFEYVLSSLKTKGLLPSHGMTIKTIVTSNLLSDISTHYGASCEETLTGFKWICNLVESYESGQITPYKKFLCGAEESYGFLAGSFVRDKDAILASVLAVEMLAFYHSHNKNLSAVLDDLYLRHGLYQETLQTITLPGKAGDEKIRKIMLYFRQTPPKKIGSHKVDEIIDYSIDGIKRKGEKSKGMPTNLTTSDVLQFFCGGTKITVRPSGTEPTIKVYLSAHSPAHLLSRENLSDKKVESKAKLDGICSDFLKLVTSICNSPDA